MSNFEQKFTHLSDRLVRGLVRGCLLVGQYPRMVNYALDPRAKLGHKHGIATHQRNCYKYVGLMAVADAQLGPCQWYRCMPSAL